MRRAARRCVWTPADSRSHNIAQGIGLRFTKEMNGPCKIVAVTPGGPAAQASLSKGFCIHEVDGQRVHAMGEREVTLLILGPPGTTLRLGVSCREDAGVPQDALAPTTSAFQTAATRAAAAGAPSQRPQQTAPLERQQPKLRCPPQQPDLRPATATQAQGRVPIATHRPAETASLSPTLDVAMKTGVFNVTRKVLAGFPLDVLKVPHLRMLTLDTCALSCIPPQIAILGGSLQRLVLPRNMFRKLPSEMSALRALRLLDLSYNRLETVDEEAMAGMCAKLKELVLSHNVLSVLPLSLVTARHLRILDVSVNRLTQLPQGIGQMLLLEDIDASGNVLQRLPDEMGALTHLKRLNLCRNLLGPGSIPSTFLRETPLDTLRIEENPLQGLEAEEGYAEFLARVQKTAEKRLGRRVGTGDLSHGARLH